MLSDLFFIYATVSYESVLKLMIANISRSVQTCNYLYSLLLKYPNVVLTPLKAEAYIAWIL